VFRKGFLGDCFQLTLLLFFPENETIEFEEFIVMMKKDTNRDCEEEYLAAFHLFDKNNDGLINESEMKDVMIALKEPCTEGIIKEMIKEADIDGDGKINYEGTALNSRLHACIYILSAAWYTSTNNLPLMLKFMQIIYIFLLVKIYFSVE